MKKLELNDLDLSFLTHNELIEVDGGGIWSDFWSGFSDGSKAYWIDNPVVPAGTLYVNA